MEIKVVKPKGAPGAEILGVIQNDWSDNKILDYVAKLEKYYGFACEVFSAERKNYPDCGGDDARLYDDKYLKSVSKIEKSKKYNNPALI